jgi:hypothetical protein
MRRLALLALVLVVAGCQGDEDAVYDAAALKQAGAEARSYGSGWPAWGKLVSLGEPKERKLCEAQTYHADPCVAVPTVHRWSDHKIRGEVFVWLTREQGRWRVVDRDYVTPDVTVRIEGGAEPAPPWLSP